MIVNPCLLNESAKRRIRIAVYRFVGSAMYDILLPIVREYRKKFPNVSVVLHELSTPEQVDALHDSRIDVGMLQPPITSQLLQLDNLK
ncbi:hypothetical protein C6353_24895 [Bacillus toyonensis]|nr:hypothetical protein C6353_24895 [Bacillus toyonensis]